MFYVRECKNYDSFNHTCFNIFNYMYCYWGECTHGRGQLSWVSFLLFPSGSQWLNSVHQIVSASYLLSQLNSLSTFFKWEIWEVILFEEFIIYYSFIPSNLSLISSKIKDTWGIIWPKKTPRIFPGNIWKYCSYCFKMEKKCKYIGLYSE